MRKAMTITDDSTVALPAEGALRLGPAPYWRGSSGSAPIVLPFLAAALIVLIPGVVLFGWATLRLLAISVAVCLLTESAFSLVKRRSRSWSESHALLMGALFACTLPPTVSWHVVLTGAACTVIVGQVLQGRVGDYLWHPVALGRIIVQVLFHEQLTPQRWPVLAPGRLIWGKLAASVPLPSHQSWGDCPLPVGAQAFTVRAPADLLRTPVEAQAGTEPAETLAGLVRDLLPPWSDTLTGVAGGAVGEACVLAVLVAGLVLMWQGSLYRRMVIAGLVCLAGLAAVLPVQLQIGDGAVVHYWLPGATVWQGLPIGLVYVCYHLTAGGFLLVLLVLAPDPSSSPLTLRGHALFGLLLGASAGFLGMVFGLPASAYWALLIANTFVPLINRLTKRRVFGT